MVGHSNAFICLFGLKRVYSSYVLDFAVILTYSHTIFFPPLTVLLTLNSVTGFSLWTGHQSIGGHTHRSFSHSHTSAI